ncbi:hypothetical protein [Bacteroides fragilis]|uniref:hypothetical protein n=1 Tax=Bacteroides fragilis TaxID=817 RepID=UPI0002808FB6|nr:hypothetical protein [Bacteroides fragilis]EKA90194.1 hypothetical protein HMPREF1203_01729 [Bacteroides fragilis HMW 610]MCY6352355.1 hypothetical protein [Bacteroides fragilis]
MTYTHFGKQADVLKHLLLCELLRIEKPQVYVETNAACAQYALERTPEQEYGIYHFLKRAEAAEKECIPERTEYYHPQEALRRSFYYQQESEAMQANRYIGSPGLAMNILGDTARYIFFDIESEPLENVSQYAGTKELKECINLFNRDSIEGTLELLSSLPASSFLHIDPYEIDKPGRNGRTYLDVFIEAAKAGMRCFLWYGYMTLKDKRHLEELIAQSLPEAGIRNATGVELTLKMIKEDIAESNPGVLGSGVLGANLSEESNAVIQKYAAWLEEIYKDAKYKNLDGSVYLTQR